MGIKGDEHDLEKRTFAFQNNEKPVIPPKSFFELLKEALDDFTLKILMVASVVSIILEMSTTSHPETAWVEGFAIIIAVIVCSTVTAVNDY